MDVKVIYNQNLDNNQIIIEVNEHTEHVNDIVNILINYLKLNYFPENIKEKHTL